MEVSFFTTTLSANPGALLTKIIADNKPFYQYEAFKQYEPEFHKVMNLADRPDRQVSYQDVTETPVLQPDGVTYALPTRTKTEKVARVPVTFQKLIVSRLTAFFVGAGVKFECQPNGAAEATVLQDLKRTWKANKLQYKLGEIVTTILSQLECALIWYSQVDAAGKVQMRCKVYRPSDGYELIPVYDPNRDLIAFGVKYKVTGEVEAEYLDLYTKDMLRKYRQDGGQWVSRGPADADVELKYGKMPVIYHGEPKSAWADVQAAIEEYERGASNYMDFIDYNGKPILFSKTDVLSMPRKGEEGKVIIAKQDPDNPNAPQPDLKYVNIDTKPEAVVYQFDLLKTLIYGPTQCPDITFDALKSLGDISGAAFDRIFTDVHLKAKSVQMGWLGEFVQRNVNFLISALSSVTLGLQGAAGMDIEPVFSPFSLTTEADRIDTAMKANGGQPVMTLEQSIGAAGTSDDPESTAKQIVAEQSAKAVPAVGATGAAA